MRSVLLAAQDGGCAPTSRWPSGQSQSTTPATGNDEARHVNRHDGGGRAPFAKAHCGQSSIGAQAHCESSLVRACSSALTYGLVTNQRSSSSSRNLPPRIPETEAMKAPMIRLSALMNAVDAAVFLALSAASWAFVFAF